MNVTIVMACYAIKLLTHSLCKCRCNALTCKEISLSDRPFNDVCVERGVTLYSLAHSLHCYMVFLIGYHAGLAHLSLHLSVQYALSTLKLEGEEKPKFVRMFPGTGLAGMPIFSSESEG